MNKKVLIVNQNAGYLTIDVANAFAKNHEEVVLFCGLLKVTDRQLDKKIRIHKTITYNRTSTIKRLWTWGLATLHLFFLLAWKYRGFKIVYYTNPPMSYINSLFFKNPFSIVVFDTYPDALKLIGIGEKNMFYRGWAWVNKKVFPKAQKIITLSEGMKTQLTQYVQEDKIHVVSIWPASENFKPIPKSENEFLKKYSWEDKFIILYSGNMGIGHQLEVMIDVANDYQENPDILFLFVGEGAKKRKLENLVQERKLKNVIFLTWQDSNVLPYSLAAADIAVVALEPEATHASVPSKTFNNLSVGSVILGIGNEGSELQQIIESSNVGFYVDGKDSKIIVDIIEKLNLNRNLKISFSQNAYNSSKKYSFSLAENYKI